LIQIADAAVTAALPSSEKLSARCCLV